MADQPWSVAFAGSGDTSEENVKALLDDWLPPELQHLTVPNRIGRSQKGLKNVKAWLDAEVGEDALSTAPAEELADVLLGHREEGSEVYLVFVPGEWDEESAEAKLVRKCIAEQIPVKDLAEGLDDFVPPEPVAPEGENKPAPRRRGKPRDEQPELPVDGQDTLKVWTADPADEKAVRDAVQGVTAAPADGGVTVNLSAATIQALLALAGALAADIKASVVEGLPASARPKVTTYPFWVDGDANYRPRKGRGRPKRDEQSVDLTLEEVQQLGLSIEE